MFKLLIYNAPSIHLFILKFYFRINEQNYGVIKLRQYFLHFYDQPVITLLIERLKKLTLQKKISDFNIENQKCRSVVL